MGLIYTVMGDAVLLLIGLLNLPALALWPDARRYLARGAGAPTPQPFSYRWLMPFLCKTSLRRWISSSYLHLAALPVLLYCWLRPHVSDTRLLIVGSLLVCGLPGIWRITLRWPVSVDAAMMTWALAAAELYQVHQPLLACAAALVAGSVKETGPVFAACYAWNPLLLAGLVAPVLARMLDRPGTDPMGQERVLASPFIASRLYHTGRWFEPQLMLAPWGVALLAFGATDGPIVVRAAVTAGVAYAQLFFATDTVRLYQAAAPPVILATLTVIPPDLAFAALAAHLFNPWAGKAET
jgi:hypothetical protein